VKRGASLLEVVIALGLLAIIIPLIFNLLPSSMLSLRRAERLQVATTLASYRMDELSLLEEPQPGRDLDEEISLPPHRYRVVREFYALDTYRMDVVVSCELVESGLPPVRLATRLLRSELP
jgi:type II secretory pathway pseudopilin PulG